MSDFHKVSMGMRCLERNVLRIHEILDLTISQRSVIRSEILLHRDHGHVAFLVCFIRHSSHMKTGPVSHNFKFLAVDLSIG